MSKPILSFPMGNSIPKCRLCGAPSDLVVKPSRLGEEYHYCAKCVDTALERAEIKR